VVACAGEETHLGGRVALVGNVVEVDAEMDDFDQLEEVDVQEMRLWSVGLPEEGCVF
jgi:hypothetical protein